VASTRILSSASIIFRQFQEIVGYFECANSDVARLDVAAEHLEPDSRIVAALL
jgi:hypothetical protein